MPTDRALTERTISMTPDEAIDRVMNHQDPDAGLVLLVMYQSLAGAIGDVLDEYKHDPDRAVEVIRHIMNHLGNPQPPTLN